MIVNGSLVQTANTSGKCYLVFTGDTAQLIPWTSLNMTGINLIDNSTNFTSCIRMTPNMISQWVGAGVVSNSNNSVAIPIVNGSTCSTITAGEIASIVIGAFVGFLILCFLIAMFIRWCAYGCMMPAMVAAPKMMM